MSCGGGGCNAWTKTLTALAVLFVDTTHAGSLLRQRARAAAEERAKETSLVVPHHKTHHDTHHGQLRALGDGGGQVIVDDEESAHHISRGLGLNSYASWITEVEDHEGDHLEIESEPLDLTLDYTNYYKNEVEDVQEEEEEEEESNSRFQNFYLRRSDNSDTFMSDVVPMSAATNKNELISEEDALDEIAVEEKVYEQAASTTSTSSSWWWGSSIMGYMRGSNNVPESEETEEMHTHPNTSAPEETHYLKTSTTSATTTHSLCGNGQLDEGEECDDGEELNGKNGHPCKKDCTSDHYVFDLSINVVNEDVEFYLISGDASSIAMIDVLEDVGMLQDELRDRHDVGAVDGKTGKPVLGSGHPAKIDPNYILYQYLDPAHCHRFVFWDEHIRTNDGLELRLKIDGAVVYDDETYRNNFEAGSSGGVKFGNCGEDEG